MRMQLPSISRGWLLIAAAALQGVIAFGCAGPYHPAIPLYTEIPASSPLPIDGVWEDSFGVRWKFDAGRAYFPIPENGSPAGSLVAKNILPEQKGDLRYSCVAGSYGNSLRVFDYGPAEIIVHSTSSLEVKFLPDQKTGDSGGTIVFQAVELDHPERLRDALEAAAFSDAQHANTREGWEKFLADHPKGPHADAARRQLEAKEDADFALARKTNTEKGWKSFLAAYSKGPKVNAARKELDDLEAESSFQQIIKASSYNLLANFVERYPHNRHLGQVEQRMRQFHSFRTRSPILITFKRLGWHEPMSRAKAEKKFKATAAGSPFHFEGTIAGQGGVLIIGTSLLFVSPDDATSGSGKHLTPVKGDLDPIGILGDGLVIPATTNFSQLRMGDVFQIHIHTGEVAVGSNGLSISYAIAIGSTFHVKSLFWNQTEVRDGTVRVTRKGLELEPGALCYSAPKT